MKYLLFGFALCAMNMLQAQSVFGTWKTIDDETGKPKSLVEIYEKDGKVYGKVIKLFRGPDEDQNPMCTECTDDRKGKPIIGMEILRGLEKDGDEYEDGTICDPKNGKIYECKMWLNEDDPNKLMVRGYLYFIYRTQTWIRQG
jgi:uncharacterized protein (DUF2147 family)